MSDLPFKHNSRKKIADNKVYNVYFDDVQWADHAPVSNYLVVEPKGLHESGVTSVTILPKIEDEFLLNRVYRHPVGKATYEVPKGFVDKGETPEQAAHRELREETGYSSDSLKFMITMAPNMGVLNAHNAMYLAENCQKTGGEVDIDFGHIDMRLFSAREIHEMINSGEIVDAYTIIAWYRFLFMDLD